MALFRKRKQQNDILPDEVKDYYRSEQRDRIGGAWLMAFGGFLLTVAIVLGLFFAGRWAYQAVFVDDNDETVDVIDETEDVNDEATNDLPDVLVDEEDDADDIDELEDEADDIEDVSPAVDASERATELPRTGPAVE